jgi:hypothetical protein
MEGVGDVVNDNAARTLEPYEGIGATKSFAEYYTLRFRTLVVASRIESGGCPIGIEGGWNLVGGYPLEIIAAVEYQIPIGFVTVKRPRLAFCLRMAALGKAVGSRVKALTRTSSLKPVKARVSPSLTIMR